MIPEAAITAWRKHAPWDADHWVEQDLVISRALVEMFSVPGVAQRLAFRGGTALHKLYFQPASRYSEDIDLVQIRREPIGDTLNLVRGVLDSWLGVPQRKLKEGSVNLLYRFDSEGPPSVRLRLKVEINSREHFTELGLRQMAFAVENQWFSGAADITTFEVNELLGTKLRALYQRKKGRDLFDLWLALQHPSVDASKLVRCFERYMSDGGHAVTRAEFEANLHAKGRDAAFRGDIHPLLRADIAWDFDAALEAVQENLVLLLPGQPWKGVGT